MTVASPPGLSPAAQLAQKVAAEMVGTFALVFAGCGAMIVDQLTGGTITHVGVALTFGLVVMAMIYATGHVSGAHFNPAVTLAFAAAGRFPWRHALPYALGQIVAAVLAAAMLRLVFGNVSELGATAPAIAPMHAIAIEIALTFFLMFVITAVASDPRAVGSVAGWAIGGTVALGSLFAGPLTGASMNPARSIGPALVSQSTDHLWLYIVGPLVGAALGAAAYHWISWGVPRKQVTGSE